MPKRPPVVKVWRPKVILKRKIKREDKTAARGYGHQWQKLRKRFIFENPICNAHGCGKPAEQVDHIIPLSVGGSNDVSNLQSLCGHCHRIKTNTIDRFR